MRPTLKNILDQEVNRPFYLGTRKTEKEGAPAA